MVEFVGMRFIASEKCKTNAIIDCRIYSNIEKWILYQ